MLALFYHLSLDFFIEKTAEMDSGKNLIYEWIFGLKTFKELLVDELKFLQKK